MYPMALFSFIRLFTAAAGTKKFSLPLLNFPRVSGKAPAGAVVGLAPMTLP
jgi:hypothetical protein